MMLPKPVSLFRSISFVFALLLCNIVTVHGADASMIQPDTTAPATRKWIAAGGTTLVMGGALLLFVQSSEYKYTSKFHVDRGGLDYLGMDKMLHGQLSYTTARLLHGTLNWAGVNEKKSIWVAAGGSLLFMTAKELIDAHNPRWGWGWADVGANIGGTAFWAAQQWGWGEQKLQLKFSGVPRSYTDKQVDEQISILFGSGAERAIKDYNQQTFWLSANLHSLGAQGLPRWLNLAVGMGGEHLYGQKENLRKDRTGAIVFDRRNLPRRRQWYLAPDIDLTKIPTNSKFLRTAFFVLNIIKVPLPGLELTDGKLKVKALAF
ncbi:DUF2279 domain-containing protein [Pseudocnuella soli]|uniref:DUF2279 domain-containing protein n=1 Tax=Pseudocnuella soli TaxID=2502779 RepID=UPI0010437D80|nr:DUF2279 domain-containing protein [Pseudocnuella soli]